MASYNLREIDSDLWKRVKARATYEGRNIRFVLMQLLRVYADHGYTHVVERADERAEE